MTYKRYHLKNWRFQYHGLPNTSSTKQTSHIFLFSITTLIASRTTSVASQLFIFGLVLGYRTSYLCDSGMKAFKMATHLFAPAQLWRALIKFEEDRRSCSWLAGARASEVPGTKQCFLVLGSAHVFLRYVCTTPPGLGHIKRLCGSFAAFFRTVFWRIQHNTAMLQKARTVLHSMARRNQRHFSTWLSPLTRQSNPFMSLAMQNGKLQIPRTVPHSFAWRNQRHFLDLAQLTYMVTPLAIKPFSESCQE